MLKTSTSRWEVEELSWLESRAGRRGGDPDKQSVERKYPGLALEPRERLACALWTQQGESWGGVGPSPRTPDGDHSASLPRKGPHRLERQAKASVGR